MFGAIVVRLFENLLFRAISVFELHYIYVGATVARVDSSSHWFDRLILYYMSIQLIYVVIYIKLWRLKSSIIENELYSTERRICSTRQDLGQFWRFSESKRNDIKFAWPSMVLINALRTFPKQLHILDRVPRADVECAWINFVCNVFLELDNYFLNCFDFLRLLFLCRCWLVYPNFLVLVKQLIHMSKMRRKVLNVVIGLVIVEPFEVSERSSCLSKHSSKFVNHLDDFLCFLICHFSELFHSFYFHVSSFRHPCYTFRRIVLY